MSTRTMGARERPDATALEEAEARALDAYAEEVARAPHARLGYVAPLLFGSGMCALVYQVAWLREMRLIFGASTAATAAVLAIFMGGLGLGGWLLGRRVDRDPRPLAFYANLELGIAAVAAITPALMWVARQAYIAAGGATVLGLGGATVVRLVLAALVLCVPTVLMGGTLPAAARAVESPRDVGRRRLAILYGVNALGAVTGAFVATFVLLEVFGTRNTLWLACLVNGLVGMAARKIARDLPPHATTPAQAAHAAGTNAAPPAFVLTAAGVTGFAFLLMELVWYRMLAPLLGGSSFTFGLILAVALLGVGLGSAAYAVRQNDRPATLAGFALTCALEAVFLAVPYALGDRLAFLAVFLRSLSAFGFGGLVLAWAAVTTIVVLPAALVAGVQFPMLIALLGRGGEQVGRHVGQAYAWNTAGAIAGSLAGGFGLLPMLSATGTWSAVVALLALLGVVAMALALRTGATPERCLAPLVAVIAAVALLGTAGPTAAWRHSPIGAGRAELGKGTPNALHDWANTRRRTIGWQVDGVESSVALDTANGYAFLVNGKSDGNARNDAATQVMLGIAPAILHGNPKRALVVGLGTGSSAGWLGAIPGIERVDVVELEPAILEVARVSAPVNQNVLSNPKVKVIIGDAREVLLTTPERYDLIVSEPSNPYRAGISSLFTREFYDAVADRLAPDGLFVQWLQAYEVDAATIRTAYATLASVFPQLETWQTLQVDLLLVGSMKPRPHDLAALRARVQQEPYRTALSVAWRADDVEGFLAHYVARPSLAHAIARQEGSFLNTDDRTLVEFGFARSVGRANLFDMNDLRTVVRARGEDRPVLTGGTVDWAVVEDRHLAQLASTEQVPRLAPHLSEDQRHRVEALRAWGAGKLDEVRNAWSAQRRPPQSSMELAMLAEALGDAGDERALAHIERLRAIQPGEADASLGRLRWRQGRLVEATDALVAAFTRYRTDPWPLPYIMSRAVSVAIEVADKDAADKDVADKDAALARRLFDALAEPFAVSALEQRRLTARLRMLRAVGFEPHCAAVLAPLEPHVPWERELLALRVRCYEATHDRRAAAARDDLARFLRTEPTSFARGLDKGADTVAKEGVR